MRGIASIANAVTPGSRERLARSRGSSAARGSRRGSAVALSLAISSLRRRRDLATTSALHGSPIVGAGVGEQLVGQQGALAGAGLDDDVDVLGGRACLTTSGTSATRRSPSAVSSGNSDLHEGAGTYRTMSDDSMATTSARPRSASGSAARLRRARPGAACAPARRAPGRSPTSASGRSSASSGSLPSCLLERAQVGDRRAAAVAAHVGRVAPGGDERLDRERGRLGVRRRRPGVSGKPPSGSCWRASQRGALTVALDGSRRRRRAPGSTAAVSSIARSARRARSCRSRRRGSAGARARRRRGGSRVGAGRPAARSARTRERGAVDEPLDTSRRRRWPASELARRASLGGPARGAQARGSCARCRRCRVTSRACALRGSAPAASPRVAPAAASPITAQPE